VDLKAICVSALFIGVFVLVPIILIMTEHQRKMAKILHGGDRNSDELLHEVKALRTEVAELRAVRDLASREDERLSVR
jgi:hypothetical protein